MDHKIQKKDEIFVIGAGMVGVASAWHLLQKGYDVTLIDRKAPGEETSYGNAGLIQREAVFPVPFPRSLSEILRILPNKSLDIRYKPTALIHYAGPLWHYFRASAKAPFAKIVKEWASLIEHSTNEHQVMMTSSDAEYLVRKNGWLQLHRHKASLQAYIDNLATFNQYGAEYKVLNQADIAELEPDLDTSGFIGGIHWLNAWQVISPGDLVKSYANDFVAKGGKLIETSVTKLEQAIDSNLWHIETDQGRFSTRKLLITTGPWANHLLKPLGYHFPLFPMRGYHQHYAIEDGKMLNFAIVDEDNGFVLSPQKLGIRLTTGADFTFLDAPIDKAQLNLDDKVARDLLPLTNIVEKTPWFGHRPCLPDMKPVIDKAFKHDNLWLAFGHAHQGFTLGPATGRLISEMIHGDQPYIDPSPFKSDRF